ncbi:SigE family RNA polymerase sigma factor [Streptomyces sp. NBRC 109706]|uniref:SigE family RNA polymerase sigma factor n=1 Tax=Streptomyces sp. NBRC 109706 TaxID=1550035 RepID=UPI00099D8210|nr:SigE family RNA polymerase sigma factor [Streptomyces sp. NBRC 109706]
MPGPPAPAGRTVDVDDGTHPRRPSPGTAAQAGSAEGPSPERRPQDTDLDALDVESDFRAYMAARWPALLRTAYLLTGNHHDAEDLAQTALTKACARWKRVRRADDPDAYVWRVLINANVDRFRRRRVREWLTDRFPERAESDSAEQIAARGVLLPALERLTPRQRAAVVLRYLDDRSETEVARLLGTGVGTVRSHTARGLAKLRADGALLALRETQGTREIEETRVRPEEAGT